MFLFIELCSWPHTAHSATLHMTVSFTTKQLDSNTVRQGYMNYSVDTVHSNTYGNNIVGTLMCN